MCGSFLTFGVATRHARPPFMTRPPPLSPENFNEHSWIRSSSSSVLLSSLKLSDTEVCEPYIPTLLATASYFCDVIVLRSPPPQSFVTTPTITARLAPAPATTQYFTTAAPISPGINRLSSIRTPTDDVANVVRHIHSRRDRCFIS